MGQVLDPPWVEFMPWRRGLPLGYKRARKQVLIAGRRGGCEECERWLCRPDASRVRTHCCSCSGEGEDKMAGREERWRTLADKPLAWLVGEIRTPPFSMAARTEAGSPAPPAAGRGTDDAAVASDVDDRPTLSRAPHPRSESHLAHHLPDGPRRHRDRRSVRQEDRDDVDTHHRSVPASAAAVRRSERGKIMTEQQRKRLEAAGWKFGSTAEFLSL